MGFGKKQQTRRQSRPGLEALEGRTVLTTFHAHNVDQLEAVIAAINNTPGTNTIILNPKAYTLTNELQIQNTGKLTIEGTNYKGKGTNIVSGSLNRVLEVDGGSVTISKMTLSGGNSVQQGGGIYEQNADVTLVKSSLNGNFARQAGGGIFAQGGEVNVINSTIVNNSVAGGAANSGGGINANDAAVTITRSTVNNNSVFASQVGTQAQAASTGGGIFAQNSTIETTGATIANNTVTASTNGTDAASTGGSVSTMNSVVNIVRGKVTENSLSTIASQQNDMLGSAFATVGGNLTITGTTVGANAPSGRTEFFHPGTPVVIQNATVDGKKISGKITLVND